jgi:hypothetical protein
MKDSVKAALWSGLVFPGAGQLFLRRYVRGAALILAALACLTVLIGKAFREGSAVADKLLSSADEIDIAAIVDATTHASRATGGHVTTAATALLAVCWIISIVDASLGRETPIQLHPTSGESGGGASH